MSGRLRKALLLGLGLPALIVSATLMASPQAAWKGKVVKEGDVTVIKNPKKPLYKTPVLELSEDLSLGGADAQGDYAFGDLRDIVVDDTGIIYVLDSENFHIKVFDPAGKLLRTIGRKGQGPGEFEIPLMMSLVKAKGELAVHQVTRRMSFFKTDGTFLRHHLFKDIWAGRGICDSTGNIYIMEIRRGESDSRFVIKKLTEDGTVVATLGDSPAPSGDTFNPFMPVGWFKIDGNDNFVYGYPETYEIQFFGAADARVFKKIVRDYEPVAVTAEERAEQEKAAPSGIVFDFPRFHAAYRWFFLSDLGHLFVATYEKTKEGLIIHDIFDADGRFIGRVPLQRTGACIVKGKLYAREEDEEGYPVLKRYTVTWKVR
jgi:hypothetical protein